MDGGGGGSGQRDARPQLLDPAGHHALLLLLGEEDQGDPQVEALADAVHAAVGEKGVGLRQDGQLVYLGKDLDIGRNISQLFRPAPTAQRENGPHPLPAPQGLQAGAIKGAAAVVDSPQGDVDLPVPAGAWGVSQLGHRGPDKGIPAGKGVGQGLEFPGSVDDGVGVSVVLNKGEQSLHRIARLAQLGHAAADAAPTRKQPQELPRRLLHQLGGMAVEGEGGGGADIGAGQLGGPQLSPEAQGVGYHAVGLELGQIPAHGAIHGQEGLGDHLHQGGEVAAHPSLQIRRRRRQIGVAGDELGAGGLDLLPKGGEGVIADLVPTAGQLPYHRKSGIGVPVSIDGEKGDSVHEYMKSPPFPGRAYRSSGSSGVLSCRMAWAKALDSDSLWSG